jgi:hypothetical protein
VLNLQIGPAVCWRNLCTLGDGPDRSVFVVEEEASGVDGAKHTGEVGKVGSLAAVAQYRHRVAVRAVVN